MLFEFEMFCNLVLNISLRLIWIYDGINEYKLGTVYYLLEKDTGKTAMSCNIRSGKTVG